jgi:hypothetical protein
MALQVYCQHLILISVSDCRTATRATLKLSFVTVFKPHSDAPLWCVLDVQKEELMRVAIICAILTGFACLMASLVGAVIAQLFYPAYAEPIIAFLVVCAGLPLGLGAGLQLACVEREDLVAWACKSDRALIVLGLISASGCLVGVLGEGQTIPLAVGTIATVGPIVGIACILPRTSRNADRRRGSAHRRGGT